LGEGEEEDELPVEFESERSEGEVERGSRLQIREEESQNGSSWFKRRKDASRRREGGETRKGTAGGSRGEARLCSFVPPLPLERRKHNYEKMQRGRRRSRSAQKVEKLLRTEPSTGLERPGTNPRRRPSAHLSCLLLVCLLTPPSYTSERILLPPCRDLSF